MSKDYKQNKEEVLRIYDDFSQIFSVLQKEVSENISEQAEKIQKEIFNLMVLGEAKSGKSTFINAYLGKEVVPMDARECTSAIIKIRRGDRFELVATTASGGKTRITDDEEIQKFLEEHAAISKKYEKIPVAAINEWLIKLRGQKSDKSEKFMKEFLGTVAEDNIYKLDQGEYNALIEAYVNEKISSWGNIITEIDITYPLPEEMQGITIIDSPGVGARGNVGKITQDYIKQANAIIFIKSLKGSALNASSFMKFMRENCTKRNKESLFLVFTNKVTDGSGKDFENLREQALELYKRDINPEKIIFVDSKVQLFLNKCNELKTTEAIDDYFNMLDEGDDKFYAASDCWYKAKGDVNKFNIRMEELSNFGRVQVILERFARVAGYLQLIEFLANLEREYKRQKVVLDDLLKTAKESVEDPKALEYKIMIKKKEIDSVFVKINEGIDEVYKLYTDPIQSEGRILDKVEEKRSEYERELQNFRNLTKNQISDRTFGELKIMTMAAIEDSKEFRKETAKEIIDECNKKLIQYTDDPNMISSDAFHPNFTETEFDKIDEKAKEKSTEIKKINGFWTFKEAEEKKIYDGTKHVKIIADSISSRLNEIVDELKANLMAYIEECTKEYRKKLNSHKADLEDDYNRFLEEQKQNDDLLKTIADLEECITSIKTKLDEVEEVKGELKNYVV